MNALLRLTAVTLLSCVVLLLYGCRSQNHAGLTGPALVATEYARERFGFKNPQVGTVSFFDEDYSVWVWDDPRKPGAFVIIHVSKEGKVVRWDPGR